MFTCPKEPSGTEIVPCKRKTKDNEEMLQPCQRKRKGFASQDVLSETIYFFENGLRKVKPYYFEYLTNAKGRWLNRSLIDIFTKEFHDRNPFYYKYAIEKGLITINGKPASADTLIKSQDLIGHKIHRHEPPCTDKDIKIVYEDERLYVIDKPGGIPVHPAGRYRHNTVDHILRNMLKIPQVHAINRLDRVTSGLIIMAKTSEVANSFGTAMANKEIRKEYVCRVEGKFPDGEVVCDAPIKTVSFKLSLNYVHEDGKPCTTIFNRMSYDGNTSVVRCQPLTGRTHQIRVHLRYLGHPIPNDPLYGNASRWATMLPPKVHMTDDEAKLLVDKLIKESKFDTGVWDDKEVDKVPNAGLLPITDEDTKDEGTKDEGTKDEGTKDEGTKDEDTKNEGTKSNSEAARAKNEDNSAGETPKCSECSISLMEDPKPEELFIWLHAWRYAGDGWAYETELPSWANEAFNE